MTKETVFTFEKVSSSHLYFLRLIALVPFKGCELNFFGSRLLSFYFFLMCTLSCIMWVGYGFKMIARKSVEVDYIVEVIVVVSTVFRYVLFYNKREKLAWLVEQCRMLWSYLTEDEIDTVKFFERKAYYFRNFLLGNMVATTTTYIISTQIVQMSTTNGNGTTKKVLPFRFYAEIDEEPIFTIVKALQITIVYPMAVLIVAMENASLYLIMMACGYLRSVQNRLLSFTDHQQQGNLNELDDKPKKEYFYATSELEMIRTCAQFHQKILLYCEEIENLTRNIFFVTVFATVYNMSIAGLVFFQKDDNSFKLAGLCAMSLCQLLFCQWSPENLLIESIAVGDAAYFASFQPSKYMNETNRVLFFIISRAQKPVQLTAGGFVKLSMETFVTMLKSAFSFFTVLRRIEVQQ